MRFAPRRPCCARNRSTNRRLHLESLEERSLMALVSYWNADGTAIDSVSGNNGTLYNGATYAAGQVKLASGSDGQAFSFDGVDDRIAIADSPSLALTQSLTIEGWIKVNAIPTHDHGEILFRGDSRGGLDPYSLAIEPNGKLNFLISSTTAAYSVKAIVPLGQFVHVAATLDDATGLISLYENSVLMAQGTTSVRPFGALDPTQQPGVGIGNANSTYNAPFAGLIDELKLYDNALTADQVQSDFNASKGDFQITISTSDAAFTEGKDSFGNAGYLIPPNADGLAAARTAQLGPDGNLYVASHDTDTVKIFAPSTGLYLGELSTPGGELDGPWGMVFGPDGRLYVGGRYSHNIVRFDIANSSYDVFVKNDASGGLGAARGLAFGPDGDLYVSSHVESQLPTTDTVKRYDGLTGVYLGDFVAAGSSGLSNATGIGFGPDKNLYVASNASNEIKRYNGQTGAFIDNFIPAGSGGMQTPTQFTFNTDGRLYVGSQSNEILRFDATTGIYVDTIASGLGIAPNGIVFLPSGELLVSLGTATLESGSNVIRLIPGYSNVKVTLSGPSATPITVDYATANGTAIAGSDYVAAAGTLTFASGELTKYALVKVLDDTLREPSEAFTVNLSNAIGGVITRSQSTVTIIDDDTRFHVVNDSTTTGTPDRRYDYTTSGGGTANYSLGAADTAPRGAASTATGDKIWVVDANKNVYVYNTSGGLLGSWSAGSLPANADVQGVTTNGTDVWIVDAKADKVYKYVGAASRVSGSQTAASSFSLNTSNSTPKDLVTDGTSIWVVNSAGTDRVFKYTVSGTLLGKWTIDPANSSPTGITIDPTNVSNIWIVDNVALEVFQYNGAASRTSGSQLAATSFALSSGNTNPQGIADPPPLTTVDTPIAGIPSAGGSDLSYDAALLGIVSELESLLMPGGKKRV